MMTLQSILRLAPFLLGSFALHGATPEVERPNIVLIYADDLGYGDVGAYGSKKIPTPHLDRLAANGLRFTSGYAASATCTPSRYALLTGEYPWRQRGTGILPGSAQLIVKPGRPTLPSVLRQGGYRTGIVGKWHLGLGDREIDWNAEIKPGPLEVGFDRSFIIPATVDRVPCVFVEGHRVVGLDPADPIAVNYLTPFSGLPTGKSHPELLKVHPSHGHDMTIVNGISRIGYMKGGTAALWRDEDIADTLVREGVKFIEGSKDQPFFLFFSLHDPHVPRVAHPRFAGQTELGPRGDVIVQLDWQVGEIMRTLDRLGLTNKTLVLVTSDNGPVINDGYRDEAVERLGDHRPSGPFRGGKYSKFEAGCRVPLILHWPAQIKPGVSDAIVGQVDFLASFAALTGQSVDRRHAPDSQNVLPALLGEDSRGREEIVLQGIGGVALRQGDWKFIPPSEGPQVNRNTNTELGNDPAAQLYHLGRDPAERINVAMAEAPVAARLATRLEQIQMMKTGAAPDPLPASQPVPAPRAIVLGEDNRHHDLAPAARAAKGELMQWHRVTVVFAGPAADERGDPNPFRDYRLNVTFSKGTRSFVVPGYFAADGMAADSGAVSGNVWHAHFRADEPGQWSFVTSFRTGKDIALSDEPHAGTPVAFDGERGSFVVAPTDKRGRDFRAKGFLKRSGRYLRFQNGEWFLKGGADSPENFLGYDGFDGAAPNSKSYEPHFHDWRTDDPLWRGRGGTGIIGALNYLASQGMNSVYFLTNQIHVDGPKLVWPWVSPDPRDWDRYDVSKLAQWEIVFTHMDHLGIVQHLVLGERENDFLLDDGKLGPIRKLYYREMVARFAHHPALIWNLGEEFLAIAANYTKERQTKFSRFQIPVVSKADVIARAKQFAACIRSLDPYRRPIVVHAQPTQKKDLFTGLLGDPNFDGPSLQHPNHEEVIHWIEASENAGQPWFVCLDESSHADPLPAKRNPGFGAVGVAPDQFEPNHDGARTRDLWGTLMAGGAGVEWYFGYQYPHNDTSVQDWRTRERMWMFTRYALEFFATLPIAEMRNADSLVPAGTFAFAKLGEAYAIYLPQGGTATLDLREVSGNFRIRWFNPRTGQATLGTDVTAGTIVSLKSPIESQEHGESWKVRDWAVTALRSDH